MFVLTKNDAPPLSREYTSTQPGSMREVPFISHLVTPLLAVTDDTLEVGALNLCPEKDKPSPACIVQPGEEESDTASQLPQRLSAKLHLPPVLTNTGLKGDGYGIRDYALLEC